MTDDDEVELPHVHYGSPANPIDWRKENLHNSHDDDEHHTPSKSTRLLLRVDPRKLFPPHDEEETGPSLLEAAEIGRRERSKAFRQKVNL